MSCVFLRFKSDRWTRSLYTLRYLHASEIRPSKSSHLLKSYFELGRFARPTGTWLLYLPCTWSIALAAPPGHLPDLYMLALFGMGSVLMRSAGCTINDMWDKKYDTLVKRTKDRPLASGALNFPQALLFLGAQLSASLVILLQLNWYSVFLGFMSMIPVITYPLFKRVTYWPQLVLGLTLNWGIWLGYSAINGFCVFSVCTPLYLAAVCWTCTYDTIYSHQDIEDDIRIGVKSTAILFGDRTKSYLGAFHMGMTACLITVGINANAGVVYYVGTFLTMCHIAHLIWKTDLKNPNSCWKTFKASRTTGLLYFLTIVLDKISL
ncbi:4-hydroxybenzoate polyprenyltransferase isoform 4 [Schistosoma japonicum]|uniref:4-hydroxybenzoate polyprenyltransferase, mitochondrial n=1 Tax=Schistosoma japonicum TaxID=6182 RepID=A0A4Z2DMC5_SCHJA|nr:4-hydroxybenzoate polyprenyltransferase, mitochondrial [Schistosoma japonicum]KAH8871321.1 4-hydroxybenzoate polyprenyltransferase, mitochondrial [Schistosoma japonicum]TNN17663.1 4-hydroxybenzoate polyprenyltransferase isoform 4 [Schistosoma japonicum]